MASCATPTEQTTSSNGPDYLETDSRRNVAKMRAAKEVDSQKKLKCTIEKLRLENSELKKALDGERSAGRAFRARQETMARKERAEFRKREESLEKQIRAEAQKCKAVASPSPRPERRLGDSPKANEQVESLRRLNKELNDRLQNASLAEKRAVADLRARDESRAAELANAARTERVHIAKLLEELKTKDRHIDQLKKSGKGSDGRDAPQIPTRRHKKAKETSDNKMTEVDRLHSLEAEINRLEDELQRRNCLIDELRSSKVMHKHNAHIHENPMANRHRKELFIRDTVSDVDSALSSGPNSLPSQPSPDLWGSQNMELELETANKKVKELQKLLLESSSEVEAAKVRAARSDDEASRLRDALRDARDHADLLEFRLLEIDDGAADKLGDTLPCIRDTISDADSGCVSPENRIKDTSSPQFNRSDSGYKSPVFRRSANTSAPALKYDDSDEDTTDGRCTENSPLKTMKFDDLKFNLDSILLNTKNQGEKYCVEQMLAVLWELQVNGAANDTGELKVNLRKPEKTDHFRDSESQVRSNKIIATISPYSQKSFKEEDAHLEVPQRRSEDINAKFQKLLQESGIFEDIDCDSKETQTDFNETCSAEAAGDLTAEIQRLDEIREQLEKSCSIRSANFKNTDGDTGRFILSTNHRRFYERRIKLLEEKVLFYESTKEHREVLLAEKLHRESVLESQIDDLIKELDKLQTKNASLEEECCELDEAENDTRLHCQQLEIDYELISAQLRDMEEQKDSAKDHAATMELMIRECEDANLGLQEREQELRDSIDALEQTLPAVIFWNVIKFIESNPTFDYNGAFMAKFRGCPLPIKQFVAERNEKIENRPMIKYGEMSTKSPDADPIKTLEFLVQRLTQEKEAEQEQHRKNEESLHQEVVKLEQLLKESMIAALKLEEQTKEKINNLELDLAASRQKTSEAHISQQEGQTSNGDSRLQRLVQSQNDLKSRIRELELREMAYLETLTQADDMWAEMESGYKARIDEKSDVEEKLKEEVHRNACDKEKYRSECDVLKQRVRELEEEDGRSQELLRSSLVQIQKSTEQIEKLKATAEQASEESSLSLMHTASEVQVARGELSHFRAKYEALLRELADERKRSEEVEKRLGTEIDGTRREISEMRRELIDLDITNGELKEEVETLERQLTDIQNIMKLQRHRYDDHIESLKGELMSKSKDFDELVLKKNGSSPPNTLQELDVAELESPTCKCNLENFQTLTRPCTKTDCSARQSHMLKAITAAVMKKIDEKSSDDENANPEAILKMEEMTMMESYLTTALGKVMECETCAKSAADLINQPVLKLKCVLKILSKRSSSTKERSAVWSRLLRPFPKDPGDKS